MICMNKTPPHYATLIFQQGCTPINIRFAGYVLSPPFPILVILATSTCTWSDYFVLLYCYIVSDPLYSGANVQSECHHDQTMQEEEEEEETTERCKNQNSILVCHEKVFVILLWQQGLLKNSCVLRQNLQTYKASVNLFEAKHTSWLWVLFFSCSRSYSSLDFLKNRKQGSVLGSLQGLTVR